jgi:hypothetical protein
VAARSALAGCAAVLLALPGCCGRLDRSDSASSLEFTSRVVAARVEDDAETTIRRLWNLDEAFADHVRDSKDRIVESGCLYTRGGTR